MSIALRPHRCYTRPNSVILWPNQKLVSVCNCSVSASHCRDRVNDGDIHVEFRTCGDTSSSIGEPKAASENSALDQYFKASTNGKHVFQATFSFGDVVLNDCLPFVQLLDTPLLHLQETSVVLTRLSVLLPRTHALVRLSTLAACWLFFVADFVACNRHQFFKQFWLCSVLPKLEVTILREYVLSFGQLADGLTVNEQGRS